jgi:pimeloyl-ACP methyl ester carboxylesterase
MSNSLDAPTARVAARQRLVLVPGLMCDRTMWRDAMAELEPSVVTWVANLRDLDRIETMAAALLAEAPAGPFALAGHSLGGRVALEVLRQAPQRVERLALLDTGWQPRPPGRAGEEERDRRYDLVTLARREGMSAVARRWLPGMLHPRRLGSALERELSAMVERCSPEAFAAQTEALLNRPDADALLGTVACPTLVLCGRDDTWSPLARHEELARRIPGAKLVVVDDCGHMSTVEQPARVTAALVEWLGYRPTTDPLAATQ